jgi:hypothetical protein
MLLHMPWAELDRSLQLTLTICLRKLAAQLLFCAQKAQCQLGGELFLLSLVWCVDPSLF